MYTAQDVRDMEALLNWRVLTEEFGATTIAERLNAKEKATIQRGLKLQETGVKLIAADDPNGQYDSPRVLDSTCNQFTGDNWLALRAAETL
jgi:hypothetical protein